METRRLKTIATRISGDATGSDERPYIGLDQVESWTGKILDPARPIDGEMTGTPCQAGDVLFGKLRPYLAKTHVVERDSVAGSEFVVLRPNRAADARFVRYSLTTEQFIRLVDSTSHGSKMPRVSSDVLVSLSVAAPSRGVQRRVADLLDVETARVDELVAEKGRFIELLAEKRSALITHAVTKGLDSGAEMMDSGVEWFGEIPADWPVVRVGHFAQVVNGSTPSLDDPEYWDNGEIPWVASGKVSEESITEPSGLVTTRAVRECGLRLVPSESVLIGMVGQGRTRGTATMLAIDATINQNVAAVMPDNRVSGSYLRYVLTAMREPIREYARGGRQAALNCELIAALRIPLPPRAEQLSIAAYLDAETAAIDELADATRNSIDLLKEYRTALISAAVTGQIDVSSMATPGEGA